MEIIEQWKDVPGFEGHYQISNFGNARSLDRQTGKGFLKGKNLSVWVSENKYSRITFQRPNKKKCYMIHRLVAKLFIGNPLQKLQVNHKDGNKSNSHFSNLEWCTSNENMQHAFDTGLLENVKILKGVKGEAHPYSKLKDIDILMIKCLSENGFNYKTIGRVFDVHSTHIGLIVRMKSRTGQELNTAGLI